MAAESTQRWRLAVVGLAVLAAAALWAPGMVRSGASAQEVDCATLPYNERISAACADEESSQPAYVPDDPVIADEEPGEVPPIDDDSVVIGEPGATPVEDEPAAVESLQGEPGEGDSDTALGVDAVGSPTIAIAAVSLGVAGLGATTFIALRRRRQAV